MKYGQRIIFKIKKDLKAPASSSLSVRAMNNVEIRSAVAYWEKYPWLIWYDITSNML